MTTAHKLHPLLQSLLREVSERKGSDIHIGPRFVPMIRINGDLEPSATGEALTAEQTRDMGFLHLRGNRTLRHGRGGA
ncbi:MAG TPA: hypothetical protein PLO76_03920, partial [Elusimicrobiota bacterium]|nr:hypothetical protein [Elusimicrobiota bacterium]